MSERCTYCGSELLDEGAYGRLMSHQDGKVLGRIYRCPNHEGFESEDDKTHFMSESGEKPEVGDEESFCCPSAMHSVSGGFYTDTSDNLLEGYPC